MQQKKPRKQPKPRVELVSKKPAFLAAFRATASITKAAKAAKIERRLHYDWLADDPEYSAAFDQAKEQAAQTLEDEAVRRAHDGVISPIVHHGQLCYPSTVDPTTGEVRISKKPLMEVKYSDPLLMFLLKGFRPDKYRDNSKVEISGTVDIVERLAAARKRLGSVEDAKD